MLQVLNNITENIPQIPKNVTKLHLNHRYLFFSFVYNCTPITGVQLSSQTRCPKIKYPDMECPDIDACVPILILRLSSVRISKHCDSISRHFSPNIDTYRYRNIWILKHGKHCFDILTSNYQGTTVL